MHLSNVIIRGFRASAESDLHCSFPGRFSVLLGPNNGGKTTIADALYLAHQHRFPQLPRASAAVLGDSPREIEVEFAFGAPADAGPLEASLNAQALGPPRWTRTLERSLGHVRAARIDNASEGSDRTRLIYLPATRNPVDELARREAEILVELLRSEQQRQLGHRNLASLRALAESLLTHLVHHDLVESVESRVSRLLTSLTSGVAAHHAFVGAQVVDDAFLSRVLEFLMGLLDDRSTAQRLEVTGLGYVNLLHLAVTLAAIPGDLDAITGAVSPTANAVNGVDEPGSAGDAPAPEGFPDLTIGEAEEEAAVTEDSFFPDDGFHVTIVVEEPEAHLHPPLQHGVLRFLKRVTAHRPELQMIVTTHSGEMIGACEPEDLVIVRRVTATDRAARSIKNHPLQGAKRRDALRKMALHLDASRSAALFADAVVLVEGVTDAVLLRVFARAWAGQDPARTAAVEALSIIPMGAMPGEWIAAVLVTPGYELCSRVGILGDTDDRTPAAAPHPPAWVDGFDERSLRYFSSHPTLEPTLVPGNEAAVAAALTEINEPLDNVTPASVDDLFRLDGPRKKKGWFAYELAARLSDSLDGEQLVAVPLQVAELLTFALLSDGPDPGPGDDIGPPATD